MAALARGLSLLRSFGPRDGSLGNKELAERTGLPRPTVARFTHTLAQLGYLVPEDRRWRLGAAVVELGYAYLANFEIRDLVRPQLQALADRAGAAASIGVLDGSTAFYLEQRRSPVMRLGNLKIHIASRIPVVGSAMGRACFAGLTTAARRAAWDALAAGMPPQRRDAARAALDAAAEEVVRQGFCTAFGSWQPDVNAVGAPLVSRDGSRVYGVTCAGPTSVLPQQRLIQEIGPRLADLVREVAPLLP